MTLLFQRRWLEKVSVKGCHMSRNLKEGSEQTMWISERRISQAERIASAITKENWQGK